MPLPHRQPPDHDWLPFIVGLTISMAVLTGLWIEGYMAMTSTAIPDQFDRLINLLAGGLLGFLVRGAVEKVVPDLEEDDPEEEE